MAALLSTRSTGISDLCEAPAKAFADARDEAVVVLSHSRPVGYIVSTQLMARMIDQLADRGVTDKARVRTATLHKARKISIDEL